MFPKGATPEDKALIVAATIMLDYMYFEERPQGTNSGVQTL